MMIAFLENAPRQKRKLPADPSTLIRHGRWRIESGRPLLALAMARVAVELHLRELATACQVGQKDRYMTQIAFRLKDVGVLSKTEAGAFQYLNSNLSSAIHSAVTQADPDKLVAMASDFTVTTRGRRRPE
jgi:hypothetical protein